MPSTEAITVSRVLPLSELGHECSYLVLPNDLNKGNSFRNEIRNSWKF